MSKGTEFRRYWPMVLTAFLALTAWVLPFYVLGPMIKALESNFGWNRAAVLAGSSFMSAGAAVATPIAGMLVDRIGARPVALTAMTLNCVGVLGLSRLSGDIQVFYAILFFIGFLGVGPGAVPFTRVLAGWFTEGRGLAMGIALSGTGLAAFMSPHLGVLTRSGWDWRNVYLLVAALMAVPIPITLLFLREPGRLRTLSGPANRHQASTPQDPGIAEIFLSARFLILALIFSLLGLALPGLMLQFVPLLIDNGYAPANAAQIASLLGLSVIFSRLVIGWMLDRVPAVSIGFAMLTITMCGCIAFLFFGGSVAAVLIVAIGITLGAEGDLNAFLAMRFFGLARYGLIYGSLFAVYTASCIVSPIIMGVVFQHAGYAGTFAGGAVAFGLGAVLFASLHFLGLGRQLPISRSTTALTPD